MLYIVNDIRHNSHLFINVAIILYIISLYNGILLNILRAFPGNAGVAICFAFKGWIALFLLVFNRV